MIKLNDWAVVSPFADPYMPPEVQARGLQGVVTGHPDFDDGDLVLTSSIVSASQDGDKVFVTTASGSTYELCAVNPNYEALFPNARERVVKALLG